MIQDTDQLDFMKLLDLHTRSIVKITKLHREKSARPSLSGRGAYIPGYVGDIPGYMGDKFQALYMDPSTVHKHKKASERRTEVGV